MLNKFAAELKEARQKSEVSLQQIAAKTRIDLKFLENIENGNFSFLPEIYIKAFLREIAKSVGLDEHVTLKKFDAARHGKPYDESGNIEEEIKKPKSEKEEIKPKNIQAKPIVRTYEAYNTQNQETGTSKKFDRKKMTIAGIISGIVIIFLIIYFGFIHNSSEIIVPEKSYDEVIKDNQPRFEQEAPKQQAANVTGTAAGDSLSLLIQTDDSSWVKMLLDGKTVEEYTLLPHSVKDIKALRNYQMIVGNASSIHFKLNNKPLSFTGSKNEVKYVTIDSTGLKYLQTPPNF